MPSSPSPAPFGTTPAGKAVERHTLTNANGLSCSVITYGGIVTALEVPDRAGKAADIVLGHDTLDGYLSDTAYLGAIVGRVANRIAHGRFTLDGVSYALATNNGPNTLHGGVVGFNRAVWAAAPGETADGPFLALSHVSPDGDEGFPGNLRVTVTYTLTHRNELRIAYEATTDQPTPVNLTNHSYFNLAGAGNVLGHVLALGASRYTPADATLIPTGEIAAVAGTPLDFRAAKPIGRDIAAVPGGLGGYDHNFVLEGGRVAARVHEPLSGRVLVVETDQPGVQLYTANGFDGTVRGKGGVAFPRHGAFCLETQHFPDAVNKPDFPTTILTPGRVFRSTTLHRFSVE